jgi:hypothetical protein
MGLASLGVLAAWFGKSEWPDLLIVGINVGLLLLAGIALLELRAVMP